MEKLEQMQKRQKHRKQEQREYGEEPLLLFSFLVILPRTMMTELCTVVLFTVAMYCVLRSAFRAVVRCALCCVLLKKTQVNCKLQTSRLVKEKEKGKGKGKGKGKEGGKNVGEMETGKQEEERGEEGE